MANASSHNGIVLRQKGVKSSRREGREKVDSFSGNKAQREVKVEKREAGKRGTKSPLTVHETGHVVSCCI